MIRFTYLEVRQWNLYDAQELVGLHYIVVVNRNVQHISIGSLQAAEGLVPLGEKIVVCTKRVRNVSELTRRKRDKSLFLFPSLTSISLVSIQHSLVVSHYV